MAKIKLMKRRSFLERAAQWVAAGTAALVAREAPAAPVAAAQPAPSENPAPLRPFREGDLVYLDSNGTVSPALPRDYYDEDLYGIYQRFARELGKAQKYTQEQDALSIFGG